MLNFYGDDTKEKGTALCNAFQNMINHVALITASEPRWPEFLKVSEN